MFASCSTSTGNTAPALPRSPTTTQSKAKIKVGWFNLGVIAQSEHHVDAAKSDFLKTIAIDPNMEGALYNYGLLSYETNDTPHAIAYLRRATTVNPKDALAWWHLGLSLARVHGGSHTAARDALNRALKLDPALLKTLGPPTGGSGGNTPAR